MPEVTGCVERLEPKEATNGGEYTVIVLEGDKGRFYVQSLNPLAYWRLGEPSGTVAEDASSHGLDGLYRTGAVLGQPGALIADADTAVSFDGIGGCVEITHDDSMLLSDGTVLFWFADTQGVATAGLLSKDAGGYGTGGHLAAMIDGGGLMVRLQSVSDYYVVSWPGPVETGAWHQVACTFGSGGMELYVNGAPADSNPYTGGLGATSGGAGNYEPVVLGANSWASMDLLADPLTHYFSGRMDEVAIFDRALTGDEVQNLYPVATVPEPSCALLLVMGVCAVRRRRRRT